jgi:hypothetical protein
LAGRAGDCPEVKTRSPRTDAKFGEPAEIRQRTGGEPAEKRLGLICAFARDEEVNAIGLFSIDCADGFDQVVAHD